MGSFWKRSRTDISPYCPTIQPQLFADRPLRKALAMQIHHPFITFAPACPTRRLILFVSGHGFADRLDRFQGNRRRCSLLGLCGGFRGLPDLSVVPTRESFQGIAEIVEQVPTIGDLRSMRRSGGSPLSVTARAIAGDDARPGMFP